jgi:hypothetical protein
MQICQLPPVAYANLSQLLRTEQSIAVDTVEILSYYHPDL